MTIKLKFAVTLQSDYHVSAGHGLAAEADSALLRDADGIPVLRGTTLVGLLRDGLWRLLQLESLQDLRCCQDSGLPPKGADGRYTPEYCGQFEPGQAQCPLCRLFGNSRRPKHWRVHSARPKENLKLLSGPQPVAENRQIVHRVRVDPRTRRAAPHKLFSQEDGSQQTFAFTVTCQAPIPAAKDEAALWVAAARFVRQLGRSRRRGQGECLFELQEVTGIPDCPTDGQQAQEALLDHFESRWLERQEAPATPRALSYTVSQPSGGTRFRLVVRADEPLLIAQRAEAGNQYQSRAVIPGSTVRGAFAWRAAYRHGLNPARNAHYQDAPAYEDFVRIFLHDGVRFPYLYPARYQNHKLYPAIPAPADWLTCKTFFGPDMHGAFQAKDRPDLKCPHCGAHTTPLGDFVSLDIARAALRPDVRHEMHIRVDPTSGRVAEGDLYTYVALEAGQFFMSELTARNAADWARLCALTGVQQDETFTLHLGRASRRGYGRVTAWLQPLDAVAEETSLTWIQRPLAQRVPDKDALITLTLLTDTIMVDKWGRSIADFDWLAQEIGLPFAVQDTFVRVQAVDGFNTHLGLPRWRDIALAAGSVAYVKRGGQWPQNWQALLAKAEHEGVGLRCAEGFGRIAFNHPLYQPDVALDASAIKLPKVMCLATGIPDMFVETWRERLGARTAALAKRCQDAPFMAVARWLHAHQDAAPADLKAQLAGLGEPDEALVKAIGDTEYGDRDKDNRLVKKRECLQDGGVNPQERAKEGLGLIYLLLERLEAEDRAHWQTGIVMLADWLAGVVTQEGA